MVCPTKSTEQPTHQTDRPPSVALHRRISYKETFFESHVWGRELCRAENLHLKLWVRTSPRQGVILVIFLFAIDATIVSPAMPTVVANIGGLEL